MFRKEGLQHVVAVMAQRDLGGAQLVGHAVQNAAAQPAAQAAHGLARCDLVLDDGIGVLVLDMERDAQGGEVFRQDVLGKAGLLLVQVDRDDGKVDGRAGLHLEQDVQHAVAVLAPEGKTTCSLCSRLRRGILYRTATELGATKIALGHHREDILETLLLNMFHGGTLKAMPPKLFSDDGKHTVIRPLAYCKESDIKAYAEEMKFPIIPCDLCGSQPNLQRQVMKELLSQWERQYPGRVENMFRALSNVVPSHLLDRGLNGFGSARLAAGGDIGNWLSSLDSEPSNPMHTFPVPVQTL
jgi:hypothetical protein